MGCGCSGRQKDNNEAFQKMLEKKYNENILDFYPGIKLLNRLDLEMIDSTPFQNVIDSLKQQHKLEIEQKIMIIKKEIENVLLLTSELDIRRKDLLTLFKEISSFLRIEICYIDQLPIDIWGLLQKDKFFIQVSVLNNRYFPILRTKKKESGEPYWFEVLSWEKPRGRNEWDIVNRINGNGKKKKKGLVHEFNLSSNDYLNFEVCKYIRKDAYDRIGNGLISAATLFDQELKDIKLNINLSYKNNNTKTWVTLFLRTQFIVDLHFLLDSQHRILSNYNEVLIKSYRKFVNIANITPKNSIRKLEIKKNG